MKKILSLGCAGLLCVLVSCNSGPAATSADDDVKVQQKKNLAASDAVGKAFETGDPSIIDSVVADDFIDHTDHGEVKGRDSLKAMVTMMHSMFKDMKMDKVRDATDGDYVYSWMSYSGTSDGQMGMPKGPYKMSSIEVTRFKDGKAEEHWAFMDAQDMAKMMAPPQTNMTDSSKKK